MSIDNRADGIPHPREIVQARLDSECPGTSPLPPIPTTMPPEAILHGFRMHQIELEMQNEELRRSQVELEKARDRYLDIYEFAPVGYLTLTDAGQIAEANLTAALLLGMERRALLSRRFDSFVVAEQRDRLHSHLIGLLRHLDRAAFDLTLEIGADRLTEVHVSGKCVAQEGQLPTLHLTLTDITALKRAQAEARKMDAIIRSTLDSMSAAIAVVDLNGTIVTVNQPWQNFFLTNPLKPGELAPNAEIGANYFVVCRQSSLLSETNAEIIYMGIRQVLDGRLPCFNFEYPLQSSESGRWFSMTVTPLRPGGGGAVIAHTEITARKRAERTVARSEARLQAILDAAMDAIITVDATQHIVFFNNAAASIFGWSAKEAIGMPIDILIPRRLRTEHARYISKFGADSTTGRHMDNYRAVAALRRDGSEFVVNASISQIYDNGAKFYTVILRDVTEQISNEEALIQAQNELRALAIASSRVREQEKRRIARELHDELGQAMTALKMDTTWIMGHLQVDHGPLQEKLTRMRITLDDTVAAMRRIAANLRPLILDDLGFIAAVESLVENFQERSAIQCGLVIADPDGDLPEPLATEVFRVLQEVLTNIAKHSQASAVDIEISLADGEIDLTVCDNGQGFAVDAPEKNSSFGLMGLRERAYLAGGTISITSAPGQGTVVDLRIPVSRSGPPA